MKLEYKVFDFKVSDAGTDSTKGIIRGYASTFGNIDQGDDVVDVGAFKKTITENSAIPILADHNPNHIIGYNIRAQEDAKGLFVEGEINLDTQLGRERYSLAKQALKVGAPMGLSIGYSVIKAMPDKERPSIRRLKELKLWEYSMVTFPMNTQAMVLAAKNWNQGNNILDLTQFVKDTAKSLGLCPSAVAEALLSGAADNNSKSSDPIALNQSLERLLKTIKGAI